MSSFLDKATPVNNPSNYGGSSSQPSFLAKAVPVQTQQPTYTPQKSGLQKTSEVLDSIFGGGKIGEWIGTKIAEKSQAGRDLKELELAGKVPAGTFDSTFSKPTGRELAGDALKVGTTIASTFVPVLKGSAVASKLPALGKASSVVAGLGNIGIGTGIGGTFGLAEGMRENKS